MEWRFLIPSSRCLRSCPTIHDLQKNGPSLKSLWEGIWTVQIRVNNKVFVEIKTVPNSYYFFLRNEKKGQQKGTLFFFNKDLKCTVGTPFHNADRGQKRYRRKRQKNGPKISCLPPFWVPKTVSKKEEKMRTQKRGKKVLRILRLVGILRKVPDLTTRVSFMSFTRVGRNPERH